MSRHFSLYVISRAVFCLALISLIPSAEATITTLAQYRLGDNDPGALAGQPGKALTRDFVGSADLSIGGGTPNYSSNTPGAGSALSMDFSVSDFDYYQRTATVTTATDNWGVEAWAFPTADPPANSVPSNFSVVAFNGAPNASGFGITTQAGLWKFLIGGIAFQGTGVPVTTNQWVHLAAVRESGTLTLYVNGTAMGTTLVTAPNAPAGFTHIGGEAVTANGTRSFIGLIDEVSYFSFSAGQFDPLTDLNLSVDPLTIIPEPGTLLLLGFGFVPLVRHARRRTARRR